MRTLVSVGSVIEADGAAVEAGDGDVLPRPQTE